MKEKILNVVSVIVSILLISIIVLTMTRIAINSKNLYIKFYSREKENLRINLRDSDYFNAMYKLIDYIEGRTDNIQLVVYENNVEIEMYNEQEILHMVSVKNIYSNVVMFRNISIIIFAILMVIILKEKKFKTFVKKFLKALPIFLIIFSLFGIYISRTFDSSWWKFHEIIFNDRLWILPFNSRMLRICPNSLWKTILKKSIELNIITFLIIVISFIVYLIYEKKVSNQK